ncbi:MAG: sugar kinase [Bacteroidia bacterium]|jgi:2-dehydro-3-deoxygluconokinase|nr:MAG: sugar kinase [Bacteroidia bacterium]
MNHKVVSFGEVMVRLSPPGYLRFGQASQLDFTFGGGEANVAVSLANYGIPVRFVTRLPENDIADACIAELKGLGVCTDKILRGGERMGIYFLETGAVARASQVIYDRAHSALSEVEPGMIDWDWVFEDVTWFHWTGITPAVSASAAAVCKEAIQAANKKGISVSTDLNYRKNLWKYGKTAREVMPGLVEGCEVILGNEEDAAMALDIHTDGVDVTSGLVDAEAYLSVSKKIMKQFPRCQKVITTLRGSISASQNTWSGVLYDGKTLYKAPEYNISHIVDRVGGGDSFMGGLIYGLLTFQEDLQSALNFAVAASCLKHTIIGDYNRVSVAEVEKLMGGDKSGRVTR